MKDALIFLLLAGAVVAFIVWLLRYGKRVAAEGHEARAARANALHWTYDDEAHGDITCTLRGTTDGIDWVFTHDSDSSSDTPTPGAKWATDSVRSRDTRFLICGRNHYDLLRGIGGKILFGLGKVLAQTRGGSSSGLDVKQEFLKNARELPVGSAGFRKYFVTVAPEGALAGVADRRQNRNAQHELAQISQPALRKRSPHCDLGRRPRHDDRNLEWGRRHAAHRTHGNTRRDARPALQGLSGAASLSARRRQARVLQNRYTETM